MKYFTERRFVNNPNRPVWREDDGQLKFSHFENNKSNGWEDSVFYNLVDLNRNFMGTPMECVEIDVNGALVESA